MSTVLAILLLTLFQFIAGFGITTLFKTKLPLALFLPLCLITGVAVFSLAPFLLQLLYIPLSAVNVFTALFITCIVLNVRLRRGIAALKGMLKNSRFTIKLYEVPCLAVICIIVFISVWRCFYLPPTPRDLTSGAEVIAEYAVKEKTMINSVFTVNLESTNNQFKPPFIISLQIIYKLAGLPFGQVWLSTIFISFVVFLYHALSVTLHRVISGLLIIAFIAIPEMYAYTFMVLFDYSNAVFFFLSIYFLIQFFNSKQKNSAAFAGLLMGFATYIRSETLVLAVLTAPAIAFYCLKNKTGLKTFLKNVAIFTLPSLIVYVFCVTVYLNHYLPVKYEVGNLINPNLLNIKGFFTRFWDVNRLLIFSSNGTDYYGLFIYLFCLLLLLQLVFVRRFTGNARNWLFAVLVVYIGLPFLGFLLPLLDIDNSTKRGLFKIFPLMLLYFGNNNLLVSLSQKITQWEERRPEAAHA
jgi:hypothetical protein